MDENLLLQKYLQRKAEENTIAQVLSVDKEQTVADGANYTSNIYRVTANIILNSKKKIKKRFILKLKKHEDDESLVDDGDMPLFHAEVNFYEKVLQQYDQLMNDYQDSNDKLWCNLIGYEPFHTIYFEDLKAENFKMADRKKMLDMNHSLLVMHSLGRFHALGHVLLKKGLLSRKDLNKHFYESNSPMVSNMIAGGFHQLASIMKSDWGSEWNETAERLFTMVPCIVEKIKSSFKLQPDCFLTVCHGDFWVCNMMFKYCPYDESIPCSVKFIDFQDGLINSYIFDVIEFLYTSVVPEIRRDNFNKLLSIYQQSLQSTLAFYGIKEGVPTLEHIQAESDRIVYFAITSLLISMGIVTADMPNAFWIENIIGKKNVLNPYNPDVFRSDHYKRNMEIEIKQWIDCGYL